MAYVLSDWKRKAAWAGLALALAAVAALTATFYFRHRNAEPR
jgi:hypothetical protein